eukprot:CAMPEP_0195084404 /NCGR_PEP_ID=MMETSP0448-20130528/25100_1 /TAXON_ID=66468 /ORGANISM="Heterocapsa triquestra, Strain CCMP 448" /LENGTH=53 /DNA_ID=CAMNT_0040117709 /DNA_START=16 /DNA_END=173 /DNA_ORIENTATION=+
MAQRPGVYVRVRPALTEEEKSEKKLFNVVNGDTLQYQKERGGELLTKKARFDA